MRIRVKARVRPQGERSRVCLGEIVDAKPEHGMALVLFDDAELGALWITARNLQAA
jgi:hypothetical protein